MRTTAIRGKTIRNVLLGVAAVIALVFVVVKIAEKDPPDIRADCTLDGFGQGRCAFTNRGKATGSQCGSIYVSCSKGDRTGQAFCSGEVPANTTREVVFAVGDLGPILDGRRAGTWSDQCSFEFIVEAAK